MNSRHFRVVACKCSLQGLHPSRARAAAAACQRSMSAKLGNLRSGAHSSTVDGISRGRNGTQSRAGRFVGNTEDQRRRHRRRRRRHTTERSMPRGKTRANDVTFAYTRRSFSTDAKRRGDAAVGSTVSRDADAAAAVPMAAKPSDFPRLQSWHAAASPPVVVIFFSNQQMPQLSSPSSLACAGARALATPSTLKWRLHPVGGGHARPAVRAQRCASFNGGPSVLPKICSFICRPLAIRYAINALEKVTYRVLHQSKRACRRRLHAARLAAAQAASVRGRPETGPCIRRTW